MENCASFNDVSRKVKESLRRFLWEKIWETTQGISHVKTDIATIAKEFSVRNGVTVKANKKAGTKPRCAIARNNGFVPVSIML